MANQYEAARDVYAAWGVDTEEALRKMDDIPVSINCWQLDDLTGFEDFDAALTGGIAATGNAPGKPIKCSRSSRVQSISPCTRSIRSRTA